MTATQQDVMLALLSLDAYSRGTVRQIERDGGELSQNIGTATWSRVSDDIPGALQDNGHGLDPIASERIFEAFFSTKPEGTGMGLAICRSIIEAHSGRLSARPLAAGETVFEFTIPYAMGGA